MKFTTTSLLSTSFLLATASAAPSPGTAYQLRVHSVSTPPNAALNNTLLTVKDESATSNPTPLGVFSTGEPRNAYTFTFSGNSDAYEAKGTKKQTHLFLTGNPVAMALYDVPIGSDPKPGQNETQVKSFIAQTPFGASGDQFFPTNQGAGTWRACKGDSTVDYTIYFFDGLNALDQVVKGCESVLLYVEPAASTTSSITGVPAPTQTGPSGYITGVPAPTASKNATTGGATPSPSSFPGAASRLGMAGTAMSVVLGAMAFML